MRDERERRDGRDGQEHRVRHEPTCDVRGSEFRKPQTSDLEPSLVSPVPPVSPVSRGYPAAVCSLRRERSCDTIRRCDTALFRAQPP